MGQVAMLKGEIRTSIFAFASHKTSRRKHTKHSIDHFFY